MRERSERISSRTVKHETDSAKDMRVTKLHWVGAMALSGLLGLGSLAQAQEKKDKPAATPAAPAAPGAPAAVRPDMKTARIEARLRGLAQRLNLTDDQKVKIKPILEE